MPPVKIHPPSNRGNSTAANPLPPLLKTPSGLAILELQGTINLPQDAEATSLGDFEVGRVDFPDYDPNVEDTAWMARVHMYIGQHQRLTGQVKKLPKPLAIVRRRGDGLGREEEFEERASTGEGGGDLEVVEIIKYKLMFSHRPEPVGTAHAPA